MSTTHWADALELRPEVRARRGHAEGLQMSLYDAVFQTTEVPYRDATYWCDITQPTTKLVQFMAEITCKLSGSAIDGALFGGNSLFHLDQGMGGGKSHALTGLWHMAVHPEEFAASDIGKAVATIAESRLNGPATVDPVRTVVLCADHFSPGVARPEFGPATNLHQRFLWALFGGDRRLYDDHVARGIDKAALKEAMGAVDAPVLILLDEIMDYVLALSAEEHAASFADEQAFLNALTGAVNEIPRAAMVVVMIRSENDEQGYDGKAGDLRSYLEKRLERNGTKVSVNEPADFGAIIRRRIFRRPDGPLPTAQLAEDWTDGAQEGSAWREHVFDKLPAARQLAGFADRLARSYPFHPDLLDLVEHDWTQHAGFQRVRSTIEVFSATAHWWVTEHEEGRWAPTLIGVGDVPLHIAAEEVLASGLLHGNDNQTVGMRQVAETDVTSRDRSSGQAVRVDQRIVVGQRWAAEQPHPAVRIATALWLYSVAVRAQGRRGAPKHELLAATYIPGSQFSFSDADTVFNALIDDEDEHGLGALDVIPGGGGNSPSRYLLVTQHNKRMFHRSALARTTPDMSAELAWERAQALANGGSNFDDVIFIPKPDPDTPLATVFGDVDQRRKTRLVVLDPRRWTLLNGRDSATRHDIDAMLGLGPDQLYVDFAASCVVACVNTQRRDTMVKRARAAYAWRLATSEIDTSSEFHADMVEETTKAMALLDKELRRSFQHIVHLVRKDDGLHAEYLKLDHDDQTALSGNDVWAELAGRGDAVSPATGLAGSYLHQLLDLSARSFTLAEVFEKFWRDPAFPLIPNEGVARRAIFEALQPDEDGLAWELVTSSGEPLHVASPDQLAIHSSEQALRIAEPAEAVDEDTEATAAVPDAGAPPSTGQEGPAPTYMVHELTITNRSLTDAEARERLFHLFSELADVLDPSSGKDIQVANIAIEINAAEGALDDVAARALAAEANWVASEEDF